MGPTDYCQLKQELAALSRAQPGQRKCPPPRNRSPPPWDAAAEPQTTRSRTAEDAKWLCCWARARELPAGAGGVGEPGAVMIKMPPGQSCCRRGTAFLPATAVGNARRQPRSAPGSVLSFWDQACGGKQTPPFKGKKDETLGTTHLPKLLLLSPYECASQQHGKHLSWAMGPEIHCQRKRGCSGAGLSQRCGLAGPSGGLGSLCLFLLSVSLPHLLSRGGRGSSSRAGSPPARCSPHSTLGLCCVPWREGGQWFRASWCLPAASPGRLSHQSWLLHYFYTPSF